MAGKRRKDGKPSRLANRYAAWAAGRLAPAEGFVAQPEPRAIGLYARGKQLVNGTFLFAGHLIEAPGVSLWQITPPDQAFAHEAHGFGWLDDLVALGTADARRLAQTWMQDWIKAYGQGQGPGWEPALTGRRLIRWVQHATFLLAGQDFAQQAAYFRALSRQTHYLARRARKAEPGLPRMEAWLGLLQAGLAVEGMETKRAMAIAGLIRECQTTIDPSGGIESRNPEELLEILTLLTWAAHALSEAKQSLPDPIADTIDRIAPCLRNLRHADGALARFHAGGAGVEGRLEQALATSTAPRSQGHIAEAMGYMRLSGGRTSVIIDAAAPPGGKAMATAHASTAAFELTSGRRALIVNCGSGLPFGAAWQLAGRASQSHSALTLRGISSSRFGPKQAEALLEERAQVFDLEIDGHDGAEVRLSHDGWRQSHGLIATRELYLSADGRRLLGHDTLSTDGEAGRAIFQEQLRRNQTDGLDFAIRFHLHPEVDATLDMGGNAISMQLRSGEIWVLRHDGQGKLSLEPSAYLEKGRLKPRPCQQILLSARAIGFETRIGWTLGKAQDTPLAIRDLDREEPAPI